MCREKDSKIIPKGTYCYTVVALSAGERLIKDVAQFGKELREFSWHAGYKEVLCPYWRKTDYGMIRCEYIDIECLDEDDECALEKARAHYGDETQDFVNNRCSLLYDEQKICNENIDDV